MHDFFKKHWKIILICLLALVIRCYAIGSNPAGFFRDEADKALTAKSLLTTGRDLDGRLLPLFVRSLKVYTSGMYQYLTIPFIAILGMSEWVIRLPAALAGTLTVWLTFLTGRELWGRRSGLVAAALLAVSPWHVHFSRWANQGILLPLFLTAAVYFFMRGRGPETLEGTLTAPARKYRFKPFLLSAVFLSLALYAYAPAKLLVPAIFVLLTVLYWRDLFPAVPSIRWPYFYRFLLVVLALALPMIYYTFFQAEMSGARFSRISIFSEARNFRHLVYMFVNNYIAHFSPSFLMQAGDANLRHSPRFVGQLLKPEAVALILGVYALVRRHRREDLFVLGWLLLGPLPAALTHEGIPHALRSIGILPAVQLTAGVGLVRLFEYFYYREQSGVFSSILPRKAVVAILFVVFSLFAGLYLTILFAYYPADSAPWWEYGYRQAVGFLEKNKDRVDEIIVTGMVEYPEVQVLYHSRADIAEYLKTREIPKYRFLPLGQLDAPPAAGQTAFHLLPLNPIGRNPVFRVNYPDSGTPAWVVYEDRLPAGKK